MLECELTVLYPPLSPFRAFDPHSTLRHFDKLSASQAQGIASSGQAAQAPGGRLLSFFETHSYCEKVLN